jgi:hypothetical protein
MVHVKMQPRAWCTVNFQEHPTGMVLSSRPGQEVDLLDVSLLPGVCPAWGRESFTAPLGGWGGIEDVCRHFPLMSSHTSRPRNCSHCVEVEPPSRAHSR